MLKKFGLVAMSVTAGLVALAPLASAEEDGHGTTTCSSETDGSGNTGQNEVCNITGNRVGEGNTFNGIPIP